MTMASLRPSRDVARVAGLRSRDPEEVAVAVVGVPDRCRPRVPVTVGGGEGQVPVGIDDLPRDESGIRVLSLSGMPSIYLVTGMPEPSPALRRKGQLPAPAPAGG